MARSVDSVAGQVLEVIPMVMRLIRKEFRSQRDPELRLAEFRSLAFINRTGGCSLSEVGEHIGLEAPTASKLVDNLVKRGLIRRQEDPDDRRRVRLQISPKGKRSIDIAFEHTRKFLARRLAHLTEKEREDVTKATEILRDAFAGEPVVRAAREASQI